MLEILLYLFLALIFAVLGLPLSLALNAYRSHPQAPLNIEIVLGLYRAIIGVALRVQPELLAIHISIFNKLIRIPQIALKRQPSSRPSAASSPEPDHAEEPSDAHIAPANATRPRGGMDWLRIAAAPAIHFAGRFPRAFRLNHLSVRGRLGLDDPMQTGTLYGYQRALMALPFRRLRLDLVPDFSNRGFSGRAELAIGIHLGRILYQALRFALHTGVRYAIMRYTNRSLRIF